MPCNTIQTATIVFGKASLPYLKEALERMDRYPRVSSSTRLTFDGGTYDAETGELKLRESEPETFAAELKREYSTSIVLSQAKRYGWQMKEIAPKMWEVVRR